MLCKPVYFVIYVSMDVGNALSKSCHAHEATEARLNWCKVVTAC